MKLLLLLPALFATQAAALPAPASLTVGEFVRAGAGFGCVQTARTPDAVGMLPCLKLGPLRIGMSRAEAEAILGAPAIQRRTPQGEASVYALAWRRDGGSTVASTQVVVIYDAEGRADVVQHTGLPVRGKDWAFSSIRLGDPEAKLRRRFGAPFSSEPVAFNGATLWVFEPWPFSFEVKDGAVVSIKLMAP